MIIQYEGQDYEFPEGTTLPEINKFFGTGGQKFDLGVLPDILGGLMKTGQSLMPEGSQFASLSKVAAPLVPFMKRPEPAAPFLQPGQTNIDPYKLMGTEEQPFTTAKGAAQLTGELLPFAPLIKKAPTAISELYQSFKPTVEKAISPIGRAIDYFRPGKTAEEFMQTLGGGKTAEENIEEIANLVKSGRERAEKEALKPKEELLATESKSRIIPSQKRANEIVKDVAKELNIKEASSDQVKSLTNAIKNYYQEGNIENFSDKVEDIFGEELNDKILKNVENKLLEMEPLKKGSYFTLANEPDSLKYFGETLKKANNKYLKDFSLESADKLKSLLGDKKRELFKDYKKSRNPDLKDKAEHIGKLEDALLDDMEKFFETLPPEKRKLYEKFRRKWAIDVKPYDNQKIISELLKEKGKGVKSGRITSQFSSPNKNIEKIINELGPSFKEKVLYNLLLKTEPGNAKQLANAILEAKRTGGMSQYITPEHEALANELLKRLRHRRYAGIAGALGTVPAAEEIIRRNF